MTKPIKDSLCALGLGLAMLPALANVAQGAPAHESTTHDSTAHHSAGTQAVISQLPPGKTIATASAAELASAVKKAIKANPKLAKAIVQGVFSQLGANDHDKAVALIDAVIDAVKSMVPPGNPTELVRAAVEALSTQSADGSVLSARSVLGPQITQEAENVDPSDATAIMNAVASILSSAGGGPAPFNFQGPGGVTNPANFSNSGGSVNSPSS